MVTLGSILAQHHLAHSTKITPYQSLYGRPPPSITAYIPKTARLQVVEDELVARNVALQLLKDNLTLAQDRMKKFSDRHCTEREFSKGDLVFLWLQPYRQVTIGGRR